MSQPHLRLARGGGYIVDLSPSERWWVKPNVEPFRSESRGLAGAFDHALASIGSDPARVAFEPSVAMRQADHEIREILLELERLDMAQPLT